MDGMKRLFLLCFLFLFGCQSAPDQSSTFRLKSLKTLEPIVIPTDTYSLQGWHPSHLPKSKVLRVYIEGDGRAWAKKGKPSTDPTPRGRLVHSLMLQDPKADIAYLARPCQFVSSTNCTSSTWTFGRYDSSVVQSMNTALDKLKSLGHYQQLELVGYSGGATIALLLAARRTDVQSVRTVAGNLAPFYTNSFHRVSPMPTALTPLDYKAQLQDVPQKHYYGSKDKLIPQDISRHYMNQFIKTSCITSQRIEGANHHKGWIQNWTKLLAQDVQCRSR